MKIDIRRYLVLRDSLITEKSQLENRLREINQALGNSSAAAAVRSTSTPPTSPTGKKTTFRRGRRKGGGISLREAVLQATSNNPLTKEQILDRVKSIGYRFSTNNPLNSLGVILYGKSPKFRNESGRFSPLGAGATSGSGPKAPRRNKRTMSLEARARIAAAQRARWAKTKAGK